ncbi:DUF4238 domain-containing protein [Pseudomonas protegens]|uniref:DUF4238 domain-containing protein n=1 Tax=Pseudomonas protegens TaxID=380021 RepID=UPI001883B7EB|nr:DUF4238 domain-containing protein [Pseudomonas protegens]MBF0639769.1 DUF4238 domain-containing protein [Pseudomonas protegens]
MLPVVRKHHYVWAYYLSAWSGESDNSIWHVTTKGNISKDSVKGLSREEDYNKIHALSDSDVAYIQLWPSGNSPDLQSFQKSQLKFFKNASALIDSHIGLEHFEAYAEIKNISEVIQYGLFERTHTIIENLAKPVIDELKRGNIECLEQGRYMTSFCNFLAQQLFRTKKIKDRCLESMHLLPENSENVKTFKMLFERNWWFLSYKLALNMGASLHATADTDHHTFITNNTDIDFITSDCPVINIHESSAVSNQGTPPESLDLYFPISPKAAYIISPENRYDELASSIDENTVKHLNSQIVLNSHLSIYGTSRAAIRNARRNYR